MKLEVLKRTDIEQAASIIDEQGIPRDHVWSQYYVIVNQKEYPFKYLVRIAYEIATNEKLQFQSNDSYRNYIKRELGFKFTYYDGGYNFFTREELEFYNSIADTKYRTSNDYQKYYGQKLYPIIAKARYWAEQLLIEGFKLRPDNNWVGANSKVTPYFWPRIYSDEDKDVFFNVEVNGKDKFIGYKLDGYYKTKKELPKYKVQLLNEYKNQINWEWPTIPFTELDEYDWERLINESKDYVRRYLSHHDSLKKSLSKDTKIARIVWNTNKWVKPSGPSGKSTNPSFEKENGYGHEEWLFDGDKVIDGIKYGFLEPIYKHQTNYEGKVFDIFLFTRDRDSNKTFWVTTLKDVQVLTEEESTEVLNHYKEQGWYDEMKADLYNLNLDSNQLDEWITKNSSALFNIKFTATQIDNVPDVLTPVIDEKDIPSTHYILMNTSSDIQEKYEESTKTGFDFENSGSLDGNLLEKSTRKRKGNEIELEMKHNQLQQKFLNYLQKTHGEKIVKRECKAYGASRIDIVQKTDTGYIFYEIKTYNSLRTSIREGLGQLFEYCFYPDVHEAEKLVLVSHVAPSNEVKTYINHIKEFLKIPLVYIHFDIDSESIISEI
jgi:hypothetical protein